MAHKPEVATMYSGRGAQLYDQIVGDDKSELREVLRSVNRGQDKILELASGSGRITLPLLTVGASVVAVDYSQDLLKILAAHAGGNERLTTVCADILEWEPEQTFDRIILGTTSISLFKAEERARLFKKIRSWLAPGGRFLLTLRTPPIESQPHSGQSRPISETLRLTEHFNKDLVELTSILTEMSDGIAVGDYSVTTQVVTQDALQNELRHAGFNIIDETVIDPQTEDLSIGDYRLLTVAPQPVNESYFQFFLPPDQWNEPEAVSASGTDVKYSDGSSAICAISGLWNASLGYGNSAIADAIDGANRSASALPIFRRGSSYAREAAERLLSYSGGDRFASVFYSTSGSAALDAVVKLGRQIAKRERGNSARRILSLIGSYHGITSSSMALTGAYLHQDLYEVDERLHIKVPHDDTEALEIVMRRFGSEIAAVVIEPVLGSGALPVPDDMLESLFQARAQHGFLIVADEVATGFYRTGQRFASGAWAEAPDMMVLSKALTNGSCAASAVLVSPRVLSVLRTQGDIFWHGETQAGSPQSCAAILATIDEFERLDVEVTIKDLASELSAGVMELTAASPVLSASGRGAMWAVRFGASTGRELSPDEVLELVRECRQHGVIVQPGPSAIQFLPALTMDKTTVKEMLARVRRPINEFAEKVS